VNRVLACAFVALLTAGCGGGSQPSVPGTARTSPNSGPGTGDQIQLPEAVAAKPLDKNRGAIIYLNVNQQGKVLLPPARLKEEKVETLDNPTQVEHYLKRQAQTEYRKQTGKGGELPSTWKSEAVLVLRIDRGCPFEKTYPIVKACRNAGYTRIEFRAVVVVDDKSEGQLPLKVPPATEDEIPPPVPKAEKPAEYVLEVRADDAGRIAKLTLRDGADPKKAIECGPDIVALLKKLQEFARKHKDTRPKLTIAIDVKLLQSHVVSLFDASVQAGFTDIYPVPLDPKER
jgi:biopolymer transport protein ExbD